MLVEQRDPDADPEVWDGRTWRDRLQETQDSARQDDAASDEGLPICFTLSTIDDTHSLTSWSVRMTSAYPHVPS